MHVQLNGGGRNCLVTSHGEKRTTFLVILGLNKFSCSWIAGHFITSEDRRNFVLLRSEEFLSFTLWFFSPKSSLLIQKYLKPVSTSPSAVLPKKTSTEDPLDEWCLIVNMLIENLIAAFTGSVLKHRRQLGMKP